MLSGKVDVSDFDFGSIIIKKGAGVPERTPTDTPSSAKPPSHLKINCNLNPADFQPSEALRKAFGGFLSTPKSFSKRKKARWFGPSWRTF
jgi:hypothetical protein